ncbi:MAG: protein phosphatase CheZ [Rhodocyclales bacterium]|nr:protein phosphatase CheZ [Rhodocyclales bacterium]
MTLPSTHDDGQDSDDLQALFDSVAATAAPAARPIPAPAIDTAGDSDDLQALFDSVAATLAPPPAAAPAANPSAGDNDELQALFDSVSRAAAPAIAVSPAPTPGSNDPEVVFNRLGNLARQLHDSLRGLGMDKLIEDSARQIPDARDRLAYIARMTEQAASRVLNATDIAKPIQDGLITRSKALSQRWDSMYANQLSVDEFKQLANDTRGYFSEAPGQLTLTNDQLMEIILAQDFQDLTGQVIKKIVELVQGLESQLLAVLLEAMPAERKAEAPGGLLNGPVIGGTAGHDVVANQTQVDDLLESLGF